MQRWTRTELFSKPYSLSKAPFQNLTAFFFFQLLTRSFSLPLQNLCSSSSTTSITTPAQVIFLRFLAFLSCAFLVLLALYGPGDPFSLNAAVPAPVSSSPASVQNRTGTSSHADLGNDTSITVAGWQELLHMLPEQMVENLSAAWDYGKNHQMAVAVLGLFTCLLAMFLAGRIRWVCSLLLFQLKKNCIGSFVLTQWDMGQLQNGKRSNSTGWHCSPCSSLGSSKFNSRAYFFSMPWFIPIKLELQWMESSQCNCVICWRVKLICWGYLAQQWERLVVIHPTAHGLLSLWTFPTLSPAFPFPPLPHSYGMGFVEVSALTLYLHCLFLVFLALQAPKNWCICFSLVVHSDEPAFSWEVPEDGNTQLARYGQIWHHVPMLLGGLHCSSGNAEINGPAEIPAPKVRARAVTLGEGGKKPYELCATGASLSSFYFLSLLLLFF